MAQSSINNPDLRRVSDFKARMTGGGARPNLFEVELSFPTDVDVDPTVLDFSRFLVKAAALPGSTVAPIDVPFRGRIIKVAGDRTFDSWTITVINDTNFIIRSAFEKWMNAINRLSDNTGITNPLNYQADATVFQLDRNGDTLRAYKFYELFPTNISPIDLSYDSSDTIEEFTVEMQVQWWEAFKGTGDNAGGESLS